MAKWHSLDKEFSVMEIFDKALVTKVSIYQRSGDLLFCYNHEREELRCYDMVKRHSL